MPNLSGIGIAQKDRTFISKAPPLAIPRPPNLNFGGLSLMGIAEQNKSFSEKIVTLSVVRTFIATPKTFLFKAKKKTYLFEANLKTFLFKCKR